MMSKNSDDFVRVMKGELKEDQIIYNGSTKKSKLDARSQLGNQCQ